MGFTSYLGIFAIAFVVFLVIDLLWLGVIGRGIYVHFLGDFLAEDVRWGAAFLFYAIFVAGLIYFAIGPAIEAGSLGDAVLKGAIYGLVTYATYELTNYAVIEDWPGGIVPIDMAWGVVLAASVSSATYATWSRIA